MPVELSPEVLAFLREPHYAVASTINGRGAPQQTVVWMDTDGENVLFNTQEGRAKPRYLRRNPRCSVLVYDGSNPYRWVAVEGEAEVTIEGAAEHIHHLSRKYRGQDYDLPTDAVRLKVIVRPVNVIDHL